MLVDKTRVCIHIDVKFHVYIHNFSCV